MPGSGRGPWHAAELLATYDDSQRLVILSADPTTESYSKLQLLGVVGDQKVGTIR